VSDKLKLPKLVLNAMSVQLRIVVRTVYKANELVFRFIHWRRFSKRNVLFLQQQQFQRYILERKIK